MATGHTQPLNGFSSQSGPARIGAALFAAQALAVTLALAVALGIGGKPAAARVVVPLEPPALAAGSVLPSWDSEVGAFALRLSEAFELPLAEAVRYSSWILEAAARQDLPPELVASLIAIESEFRADARSAIGAIGPAQVVPRYWSSFCGSEDLSVPEENVYCGAQILAHYMERCGGFVCALEMYNVGPRNVRKAAYAGARARYIAKVSASLDRLDPSLLQIL